MGISQLPEHLQELLWAKLGDVAGSPPQASQMRRALYSTCKAIRSMKSIKAELEPMKLALDQDQVSSVLSEIFGLPVAPAEPRDLEGVVAKLSALGSGRALPGVRIVGSTSGYMALFKALHAPGPEVQAARMVLEGVTELQWSRFGIGPSMSIQDLMHLALLFPHLTSLHLHDFRLPSSPADLASLRLFRHLRRLQLQTCELGFSGWAGGAALMLQLGRMTEMRDLDLDVHFNENDAPDSLDASPLGNLHKLTHLQLWVGGPLELQSLRAVAAGCRRLRHLGIGYYQQNEAAPAAPEAEGQPAQAGLGTWPELRTLSLLRTSPQLACAVLDALGPLHDTMPALQRVLSVEVDQASDAPAGAMQQLCQRLSELPVPVKAFTLRAWGPTTSPAAAMHLLGPMAQHLTTLRMHQWQWTPEDVRAVAAVAPGLRELGLPEPSDEVVAELVQRFHNLTELMPGLTMSSTKDHAQLLRLCAVVQTQLLAAGRQHQQQQQQTLTIRTLADFDDEEALPGLAQLQQEWAVNCEGPQLVFLRDVHDR